METRSLLIVIAFLVLSSCGNQDRDKSGAESNSQYQPRVEPLANPVVVLTQAGTHSMWWPYNAPRWDPAAQKFIGYFIQDGQIFRAESPTGLNGTWVNRQIMAGDAESIVKVTDSEYWALRHVWDPTTQWYYQHMYSSTNGVNFNATGSTPFRSGEDMTLLYRDADRSFLCYVRPRPPHGPNGEIRKIGFTKSTDFVNWTPINTILAPNAQDHPQKQFYSMSVVHDRLRQTYWGFLNVFQVRHEGGPPYPPDLSGEDNAVRVQLCVSADGVNWTRCFGQNSILAIPPGIYEQFAVASIREGSDWVDIYVIQSRNRHNLPGTDFYTTVRYTVSLVDLAGYIPPPIGPIEPIGP